MEKKTPLYKHHLSLHANMTIFGGFLMPLYYTGITAEHNAVRTKSGIFDVSHMGELLIKGKDALKFINEMTTNLITDQINKMTYSILTDEHGYPIDDLMIYVFNSEKILIVCNASNIDKDFNWLNKHAKSYNIEFQNISERYGEIALQGPLSEEILSKVIKNIPLQSMTFEVLPFEEEYLIVSRSGYTGEDGFEIYGSTQSIIKLWEIFINEGVTPCGLGSRDTLRFESNMPLYEHELSESITPIEAGLGFAVNFEKPHFIGKDALWNNKFHLNKKIVGIELTEKNIPRAGYKVYSDEDEIGFITTGYLSPTVQKPIALALINIEYTKIGTPVFVEIRGRKIPALVRNRKFYQKNNQVKGDKKND